MMCFLKKSVKDFWLTIRNTLLSKKLKEVKNCRIISWSISLKDFPLSTPYVQSRTNKQNYKQGTRMEHVGIKGRGSIL
jgi:hypothetical protein